MSSITNHHRISGAAAAKLLSAHRLTVTSPTLMHRSNQGVTVTKTRPHQSRAPTIAYGDTRSARYYHFGSVRSDPKVSNQIRVTIGTDVPLHD